jgi:hypothetical protein
MRQIDQVAAALASALRYSRRHNDARVKVLCHGSDTDAREVIVIVECRIRARSAPLVLTDKKATTENKSLGLTSDGELKTSGKTLIQEINDRVVSKEMKEKAH